MWNTTRGRSPACGAVGSALPWRGRGREFESHQVHQNISNTYSQPQHQNHALGVHLASKWLWAAWAAAGSHRAQRDDEPAARLGSTAAWAAFGRSSPIPQANTVRVGTMAPESAMYIGEADSSCYGESENVMRPRACAKACGVPLGIRQRKSRGPLNTWTAQRVTADSIIRNASLASKRPGRCLEPLPQTREVRSI